MTEQAGAAGMDRGMQAQGATGGGQRGPGRQRAGTDAGQQSDRLLS
jgi:hypothetical protein